MNCNQNCHNGISSSKCVEFNESHTVYEELVDILSRVESLENKFNKGVDSKTLGVGTNLILAVQKLIDNNISTSNTNSVSTSSINIDMSCLSGNTCNTIVTSQEQFNQIILNTMCSLINEVNSLKTINNLYPNV